MREKELGMGFPAAVCCLCISQDWAEDVELKRWSVNPPSKPSRMWCEWGAVFRLGLVRDPLVVAPVAYACNEVMSASLQVALAVATVVS